MDLFKYLLPEIALCVERDGECEVSKELLSNVFDWETAAAARGLEVACDEVVVRFRKRRPEAQTLASPPRKGG